MHHKIQLPLNNNFKESYILLEKELSSLPEDVTRLDLSGNKLSEIPASNLAYLFSLIKIKTLKTLDLSENNLNEISASDLALLLAIISADKTILSKEGHYFVRKPSEKVKKQLELNIDRPITILVGDLSNTQLCIDLLWEIHRCHLPRTVWITDCSPKKDFISMLDKYLAERQVEKSTDGEIKKHSGMRIFSLFSKSYQEKLEAIDALKSALNGEKVDLVKHIATLDDGKLGAKIKQWISYGVLDSLVDKKVRSIKGFVQALEEKNSNPSPIELTQMSSSSSCS